MPAPAYKRCTTCDETKPLAEFHRDKNRSDGHGFRCKACQKAYTRQRYRDNREAILASNRAWEAANRERMNLLHRERHKRDRKKVEARNEVRKARRNGVLSKPDVCEDCSAKVELQAHHPDYDRPLDVRWVCRDCHTSIHNAERDRQAS